MPKERVLITVRGGVANYECDGRYVDVLLLDFDNIEAGSGLPTEDELNRFATLMCDPDREEIEERLAEEAKR